MNTTGSIFQPPQRLAAAGVLVFIGSLLAACEAPQKAPEAVTQAEVAPVAPAALSSAASREDASAKENPDLDSAIKMGMSYSELRTAMTAHGWRPMTGEFCLVNTVGENHKAFCAEHPDSQTCKYCSQLPGLVRWSADGYVLFLFEHSPDGKRLEVGMNGELEGWKYNTPDTMLGVSGWRYALKGED